MNRGVRETKLSIASYCDLEIWRPPSELILNKGSIFSWLPKRYPRKNDTWKSAIMGTKFNTILTFCIAPMRPWWPRRVHHLRCSLISYGYVYVKMIFLTQCCRICTSVSWICVHISLFAEHQRKDCLF
jgi:hypothetical protein